MAASEHENVFGEVVALGTRLGLVHIKNSISSIVKFKI
jgi:hypothetical protein